MRRQSCSIKRMTLVIGVVLVCGAAACGGDGDSATATPRRRRQTAQPAQEGPPAKIAVSVPAADHGWLKAVSDDAKKEGEDARRPGGAHDQRQRHELGGAGGPDRDAARTRSPTCSSSCRSRATRSPRSRRRRRRRASTWSTWTASSPRPGAFRTWIGGDNYGIGWQAGNFFADELKCAGNVVEIQGLAGISVTEDRSKGFKEALTRALQGRHQDRREPARRLRARQGPLGDGEHPPGPERHQGRVHARRRHGRGRRGRDRERRASGRHVPHRRRRLEGRDGAHRGRRPVPRDVPLQPDDGGLGRPAREPDRATTRAWPT